MKMSAILTLLIPQCYILMDEIFQQIGDLGPSQRRVLFFVCLVDTYAALHTLNIAFIGTNPGWKCLRVASEDDTRGYEEVDAASKCLHYERGECTPVYSEEYTSLVTEWNLICDKSYLPYLSQSGYFVGLAVGAWIFGAMADRVGRKKVLFLALLGTCFSGFASTLAGGIYSFALLRGIVAMFNSGVISSCFVLRIEIVGTPARSFAGLVGGMYFSFGFVLLALFAYFIRDWRLLVAVCTLCGLLHLLLWRIVPESPRWLLVNGQEEQARVVLAKFAQGNGTTMPEGGLKIPVQAGNERVSVIDLFRGRVIRHRTIILIVTAFVNSVVINVFTMNAGRLGGSRYVSVALSGIVEIPSLLFCYFIVKSSAGRRWTHGGLLMSSGIGCLAWLLLHWIGSGASLKMAVALLGKLAVTGSYVILKLYAAELFPTQIRNLGRGLTMIGARVGGVMAPAILLLGQYSDSIPMLVMAMLSVLGGIISLSLPETLNQPLPETLAELEMNKLHKINT